MNIAFSKGAFANQYMNPEDIRIAIAIARDAWIARDAEALAALFAPDGEIIVPGQRWQGQERIRQEVTHFAQQYSDVRIEIPQIIVDGDRAVVEWYYEDPENATGRRNKADDVIVINFKEGRISRWREYFDTETPKLRRQ
ncbi:nuclear transport factor 2 family protein [Coleofasciculus sp. H7-2]|uniref:nuclear transport factor 2 family protein n=1 Tax=Coleofasciculus sp. H7-2 TaxID=3351545 RepID=UPI00366C04D9